MTSYRTAGTDHAAVAAAVVVVECTFAVVFSVAVAEPAVVVVSAGVAAGLRLFRLHQDAAEE